MKFNYIPFNIQDESHKEFIQYLRKENPNYGFLFDEEAMSIVEKDSNKIGAIVVKKRPCFYNAVSLDIALLAGEQKKGYGTYIYETMGDYLIEQNITTRVMLDIKDSNINSKKAALKAGYEIDYSILELFDEEGYKSTPYSKQTLIKTK